MKQVVFCSLPTTPLAEQIVDSLRNAGFRNTQISVLLPNVSELRARNVSRKTSGSAVMGGALGWLAGIEAFNIPGIGPIVAAGPIVANLCDTSAGALNRDIVSAVIGFGMSETEARQHYLKLKEGMVLIYAHIETSDEVIIVESIFRDRKRGRKLAKEAQASRA